MIMSRNKILLYGAGADCKEFFSFIDRLPGVCTDEIVGIADSAKKSEYITKSNVYQVKLPQEALQVPYDKIVISTSKYEADIRKNLIELYGVDKDKIVGLNAYKEDLIINYQYSRNLLRNESKDYIKTKFSSDSMVVYTAILGPYDTLKDPLVIEDGVKYICFTDQNLQSDVWEIHKIDTNYVELALMVRKLKLLPHLLFKEYKTSIWVDASLQISSSLRKFMEQYQFDSDILLFPHPQRLCIYDEAAVCALICKAGKDILLQQISSYYAAGYPIDNGLFCGGFIVRNHNKKSVIDVMNLWYDYVKKFSLRDQISLPIALWEKDVPIDLCPLNIWNNKWVEYCGHL